MENYFKVNHAKVRSLSLAKFNDTMNPKRHSFQQEQMAITSLNRASNWSKDKLFDQNALQTLSTGTIPLAHPENHEFREKNRAKELHKTDIYLRRFQPAKARAQTALEDFQSTHLEITPFPIQRNYGDKPRVLDREMGHSIRFGGGHRTENERLAKHLDGTIRFLDPGAKENRMIINPQWKDIEKDKWVSKKDFDLTTCYFRGKKSKDPWPIVPIGINIGDNYIDGVEVVGDLSKKRKKELEISTRDFLTTVTPNHNSRWKPILNSNSVRTVHSAKFFERNPEEKRYPKTLKHLTDYVNDTADLQTPLASSKPPVINIRVASPLSVLRESAVSSAQNKLQSARGTNQLLSIKKVKNQKPVNKDEYIKKQVRTYFG